MTQSPLKIGVVCYPSYGGSGVVGTELALAMARRGHELHLIASAPPARFRPPEANVVFHRVSVPSYPLFEHAPYTLALAATIAEVSRSAQLDIVHTHYAVPHVVGAYLARKIVGAGSPRLIATLHGTDVSPVGNDPHLRPVLQLALRDCDAITVPSAHLRARAFSELELPPDLSLEVIPNFVDTTRFRPGDGREPLAAVTSLLTDDALPLLIHVSNFRPLKRVLDAVEVFAQVVAARPARLVLVGDGPERGRAEQRLRALGLEKHAHFLGNRGDVAELLRCCDVMLAPSENESFGLAALEALSSGVPVVAARVGGLEELIQDGQNGFLAAFGDIEAMARAVLLLLEDPARAATFRAAARVAAETRWHAEPIIDRFEACYRRTLEGRR